MILCAYDSFHKNCATYKNFNCSIKITKNIYITEILFSTKRRTLQKMLGTWESACVHIKFLTDLKTVKNFKKRGENCKNIEKSSKISKNAEKTDKNVQKTGKKLKVKRITG